jgi:ribonuclease T1
MSAMTNYLRSFPNLTSRLICLAFSLLFALQVQAFSGDYKTVPLKDLPVDAQKTFALIKAGGPFPYAKDGTTFGNREKRLPRQPRGYYKEYTVKTPGARNRGARRIVCGGRMDCYYTDDHYDSFKRIVE